MKNSFEIIFTSLFFKNFDFYIFFFPINLQF